MQLVRAFQATLVAVAIMLLGGPSTADDALNRLVKQIVNATTTDGASGFDSPFISGNFEPALVRSLRELSKSGVPDVIDFDFITDSQDPDYDGIKRTITTSIVQQSDASAMVTVLFRQYEGDSESKNESLINYEVRKISGSWKVYNIVYPNGDFNLRQTLGMK